MRDIVEAFRRPPTVRLPDRNGGFPRLSGGVAHGYRCPASPRHALLAENLGKPSLWVIISAPWYNGRKGPETGGEAPGTPGTKRGPSQELAGPWWSIEVVNRGDRFYRIVHLRHFNAVFGLLATHSLIWVASAESVRFMFRPFGRGGGGPAPVTANPPPAAGSNGLSRP